MNATEVRPSDFDSAEGNTVDGVRTHVSRASEKGIRMKMPITKTTAASIIGSRGVVGGWTGSILVLILDGVGDFPSLFALRIQLFGPGVVDQQLPGNNLDALAVS